MGTLRVILSGGLGNQLFQYATATALAERTGIELVLDTFSGFKDDHVYKRQYELHSFPGPQACKTLHKASTNAWIWFRLRQRIRPRFAASGLGILDEELEGERLLTQEPWQGTRLLMGFWQDERYFEAIRDRLRRDISGTVPPVLPSGNHVAMHVRRVQYTRGIGEHYFLNAMTHLRTVIPGVQFHLYTDDPDWGAYFAGDHEDVTCQSRSGGAALDDFSRLRSYQHFIIANSTFSWWAAWLGAGPDSHVICPAASAWPNPYTPSQTWKTLENTI